MVFCKYLISGATHANSPRAFLAMHMLLNWKGFHLMNIIKHKLGSRVGVKADAQVKWTELVKMGWRRQHALPLRPPWEPDAHSLYDF